LILMSDYKIVEKPEWGHLATFVPNKAEPVYSWLYYKEGFSKELVFRLAEMFSLRKGMRVFDPFCGAGTTLLACRQLGLDSMGLDVHPVAVFASKVKTRDYDTAALRQEIKSLIKAKFQQPKRLPDSGIIRRVFPKHTLEDAVFFRDLVMQNHDNKIRDFLMLGLMNVAVKCSYAYKDGAVIKVRKKPTPPLRDMLRRQLFRMLKDAENFKHQGAEASAEFGDARSLPLEPDSMDSIITSPPYLNKIEYTKIYEIEQSLFLSHVQDSPPVRSYIGLSPGRLEQETSELEKALDFQTLKSLPPEAVPYMTDMLQSIREMHRVCKKGARLGIVVGNGCFPTGVVDSDILLSRMAESIGFKVDRILVLNKRWCTRNRTEKVGIVRESLLLWEK
jgi:DNA modification methylase